MSNDSITSKTKSNFNSKAVISGVTPLMNAIYKALEEPFDVIFRDCKHLKTVEDILHAMRKKANYQRVSLADFKKYLTEVYEGLNDSAIEFEMNAADGYGALLLGEDGLLDVNDALLVSNLLYPRYDAQQKARLIFACFDANDDGDITREEMTKALTVFFEQFYGLLEDGVKDPAKYKLDFGGDFTPFLPGLKRVLDIAKVPQLVNKAFAAADRDGDQKISKHEWAQWTSSEAAMTQEWGSVGVLFNKRVE